MSSNSTHSAVSNSKMRNIPPCCIFGLDYYYSLYLSVRFEFNDNMSFYIFIRKTILNGDSILSSISLYHYNIISGTILYYIFLK